MSTVYSLISDLYVTWNIKESFIDYDIILDYANHYFSGSFLKQLYWLYMCMCSFLTFVLLVSSSEIFKYTLHAVLKNIVIIVILSSSSLL